MEPCPIPPSLIESAPNILQILFLKSIFGVVQAVVGPYGGSDGPSESSKPDCDQSAQGNTAPGQQQQSPPQTYVYSLAQWQQQPQAHLPARQQQKQQQKQQQQQPQTSPGQQQQQPPTYPPPRRQGQQGQQQQQQQQQSGPNKESLIRNRLGTPLQARYDDNAVNQQNPQYKALRARAHDEGDAMARCFTESKEAYNRGDGVRATELSNEGKAHKAEMERLDAEASQWIFHKNNRDSRPDELNLHGLYVKEAIQKTEEAITAAQNKGDDQLKIIVGKGLHSQDSAAKIKPAVEHLLMKRQLVVKVNPQNAGVLIITLKPTRTRPGHGLVRDCTTD